MRSFCLEKLRTTVPQCVGVMHRCVHRVHPLLVVDSSTTNRCELTCRRACSQQQQRSPFPTKTNEEADEEMLVRMLVQDAFHPLARKEPTQKSADAASSQSEATLFNASNPEVEEIKRESSGPAHFSAAVRESDVATTRPTYATVSDTHSSNGGEPSHVAASLATPAASSRDNREKEDEGNGVNAITDSRRLHVSAELFAVVRRTAPTPASSSSSALPREDELEWMCQVCQAYTPFSRSSDVCQSCGAPATLSHRRAKPPVRHVALMPSVWVCVFCSHTNNAASPATPVPPARSPEEAVLQRQRSKFLCSHCGKPFTGVQMWTCPACDHACPRAATQCPTCFAQRPAQWRCRTCSHDGNSIFSVHCSRCQAVRPTRYSNSIARCSFCQGWNDVRWELCASCMAPTSAMLGEDAISASHCGSSEPDRPQKAVLNFWEHVAGHLVRDARGLLHSKTVDLMRSLAPVKAEGQASDHLNGEGEQSGATVVGSPRTLVTPLVRKRTPVPLLDNAWWCSTCNVAQRRNASFCDICLQSRNRMLRMQQEQLENLQAERLAHPTSTHAAMKEFSVLPDVADGDWRCPYCCRLHPVAERECCGHPREVAPGYWLCDDCGSTNHHNRLFCLGCGQAQARVCPWTCAECSKRNSADAAVCVQCGVPHGADPSSALSATRATEGDAEAVNVTPTSIVCPVCAAPNQVDRLACYRCRARLHDVEWTCHACGQGQRDRQATRCPNCKAVRPFNLDEELWVCEVCSTGVYSGGDLPVRTQCPKCKAARAVTAPHFPARWRCPCGLYNRARVAFCPECGTRRLLPSFHSMVSCPHCFRDTNLDPTETCEHCAGSLSGCFDAYENTIWTDAAARGLLTGRDDGGEEGDVAAHLVSDEAP